MRNTNLLSSSRILAFLCLIFLVSSCTKEEKTYYSELIFPSNTYYISNGASSTLPINQGNARYDLSVADNSLFTVVAGNKNSIAGYLEVTALKKGTTTLSVTDKVNHKKVDLTIHVVDPYLLLNIAGNAPQIIYKNNQQPNAEKKKEIETETMKLIDFEGQNSLILQKSSVNSFKVFKDEQTIQSSNELKHGTFELALPSTTASTLSFFDENKTTRKQYLLRFGNDFIPKLLIPFGSTTAPAKMAKAISKNDLLTESTLPNPAFYFECFKDVSAEMKAKYPEIETAKIYMPIYISLFQFLGNNVIGPGILMD